MVFAPEALADFLDLFEESSPRIRAFPGCLHLELWQDARFPNIMTTFSHWTGDDALQTYRESELFKSTWARTKPWFAAAPVAHSQSVIA